MSFKRPFVPQWGRQRTQAEVELDRRLEEAARRLAGPAIGRDEWVRAQYRAASRGGATKAQIEQRFNHSDMQIMDAHVDQMFWQMVRHELRTNPTFDMQLQFIERFYELPQHEFLLRIKTRFWALMQQWTDDRRHMAFRTEVMRAYKAAKEQIEDVDPANDERRAQRAFVDAHVRRQMIAEDNWRRPDEYNQVHQELWDALDEDR